MDAIWWPRTQPVPALTCSGTASAASWPSAASTDAGTTRSVAEHAGALQGAEHQPLDALPLAEAQAAAARGALGAQEPRRIALRSALVAPGLPGTTPQAMNKRGGPRPPLMRPGSCCGLPRDQATWPLTSMRMATEALVCSPLISLKYVRRCTSGLWPITAATSA